MQTNGVFSIPKPLEQLFSPFFLMLKEVLFLMKMSVHFEKCPNKSWVNLPLKMGHALKSDGSIFKVFEISP